MHRTFRSLSGPCRVEIDKIKGSRFIGHVCPVSTEEQAKETIQSLRSEFHDARHHCFGYRLSSGVFRYSDDGEPSGSAGQPILRQIDGHDIDNVLVVVIRYFGGTKLGVGGLVRAYGAAAKAALDGSNIIEEVACDTLVIRHSYDLSGAVKAVLSAHDLTPTQTQFTGDVTLTLSIPEADVETVKAAFIERTAGLIEFMDP